MTTDTDTPASCAVCSADIQHPPVATDDTERTDRQSAASDDAADSADPADAGRTDTTSQNH